MCRGARRFEKFPITIEGFHPWSVFRISAKSSGKPPSDSPTEYPTVFRASQHPDAMINALSDAVESLSILLKRSRELRRSGQVSPEQLDALDQLIDQTFESIHLLLRMCREGESGPEQDSPNPAPAVKTADKTPIETQPPTGPSRMA
jgi:hypothetical protein